MTTRFSLLVLLSVAGQHAAAQTTVSQRTTTVPSKSSLPKTYASNIKKSPAIETKTPKIGETLAVLNDFPVVHLPETPTKRTATTYQPQPKTATKYSTNTKNGITANVRTTTQRSANGSSTMTITTYSGQKTYEPAQTRKPPVTKTVVVPNHGKTVTTYAASTPQTTTVRVKNGMPTNAKMPVNAAPTTVRTALRTPIATTSGATAFSESQRAAANTGAYANYLTSEEKKVLQLINLARTDGNLFLKEYADKFIASNPVFKGNKFAQSLYVDLRKAKGLPPLTPNEKLYRSARAHAMDIGTKGMKGHDSSNGDNFNKRIPKFLSSYSGFGENISYGTDNNTALPIVMLLLIDNNNADYGHRKNILSPSFESIGAAIQQHKSFGFVCVQDFGTDVQ